MRKRGSEASARRDLQQALAAVGKVPRKVGVLVVQPDEGQLAHGAFHGLPFLAALRGGAEEGGEQPRPHTAMASRQHVLKDAHVLEQPDVLERPAMPNSTILWVGLPVMSFRSKMTSPESGR